MPSTKIALLKNLLKQMRGGLLSSDVFNPWTILKFTYMLILNFIKSIKIKSFSFYYPNN